MSHRYTDKYLENIQQSEQYLRESISLFEELFRDLREKHDFKISIVDTYEHAYKALGDVLILTNRPEEALVSCERGRACALGDILVSKYGMQQQFLANMSSEDNHLNANDLADLLSAKSCFLFYAFTLIGSAVHIWIHSHNTAMIHKLNMARECININMFGNRSWNISKLIDTVVKSMHIRHMAGDCEDRSLANCKHDDEQEDHTKPYDSQSIRGLIKSMEVMDFGSRNFETNEESDNYKEPLKELFEELIIPVQQHLTDEIVIIPEGPLYSIPFGVLQNPDTGQFLCETKRIRLAPSLTTLKILKKCPSDYHSSKGALVIGNPSVGKVMLRGKKTIFVNLPAAEREAHAFSQILNVEPLIGIHATKDAVKTKLREGVEVIHIAAHGDNKNGEIALAPGISAKSKPIPEEEDYILTMEEVEEIGVRSKLVVLSCCHSGRGEIRSEGVVGMSRAFLAAGARAVVASLWAIDDSATYYFMHTFYSFLKRGDSASVSLNEAMNDLRQDPRYSDPKYWAPFFLIGDDVTIF